jgi:preprotein translocase subunit SecB
MFGDGRGQVTLFVTVTPDPSRRPYEIQVEVCGRFRTENGSEEQLLNFCKKHAPAILFPYVRQLVHMLSSDGQHGRVRLHPMNLRGALEEDNWTVEQHLPENAETKA